MTGFAAVVVVFVVMTATAVASKIIRHRRDGGTPRLGDADAFEGNLLVPPAEGQGGGRGSASHGHRFGGVGGTGHGGGHGGFGGHSGAHGSHGGHDAGGAAGGGAVGGGHH